MRLRTGLAAIPLLTLPVAAYAMVVTTLAGGLGALGVDDRLTRPLIRLSTTSGEVWPVSAADLLLASALIVAFVDLLRGAADRRVAILNHALSIALFTACLSAMLLWPAFANSTFFLITLMVLLDLAAGFIVTMGQARGGKGS